MKYLIATLVLASSNLALAGPFAPAAEQPGSTAIHMDDSQFVGWANSWSDYIIGSNVDATFQTPNKALGQPVGDSFDIVSLGTGGSITLGFAKPIANGAGFDFAVFENSITDTFLELAWVEVSSNGSDFFRFENISFTSSAVGGFGSVDPTNIDGLAGKYRQGFGTPFDLDEFQGTAGLDLNQISHVRLVDIVGNGSALDSYPQSLGGPNTIYDPYPTTGSAGFDLDAVGVINVSAVPLPASLWLFVSALTLLTTRIRSRVI